MDEQLLIEKAEELISLKREINKLMSKMQELKQEIMPAIQEHGAVKFDFGRVYYSESKGSETFSRKDVLQYLRDAYGDALADQVDEDCTKHGEPKKLVYVKVNDL
ncbi:hypothetical protein L9G74_11130 [Shewanella sp. C32]|uniref:Uncharacterized protein n=1 Tax=Shewanella electrica TaxID=515560 RepID=A0ABT2FM06_9GAMM|nr:hypothetical protein [Shewanella electrica]MCH1923779.1 hypothetical protein [Shewanella electrica]MCS4556997.1 hypothetical protein [Shewanella electrica]